jgi:hypothetical protein
MHFLQFLEEFRSDELIGQLQAHNLLRGLHSSNTAVGGYTSTSSCGITDKTLDLAAAVLLVALLLFYRWKVLKLDGVGGPESRHGLSAADAS